MALPANFLDELRAHTPMQALVSRTVKLSRSGRDTKGCCPFHAEKTPSFYVFDDHFHCFGCGEHGDAITFVMKTTGAGFMESVESLAGEAGLDVPKASPQAAEAEQKRAGIADVLEAAAKIYHRWLYEPAGLPALDYLRGRGLTDETIAKFGLGWSGEGRGTLASALRGQNITTTQLTEAGLMKEGDYGPVDMFFSRVMFPIADRRGIKTSFSGRIIGDGQPKYVNGPETAAFSKRRSLYGLHLARDAVRKGAPLILVEGQMDVIALAQAGFTGAIAPLGTALTEEQLAECWRLSPDPVICFDADPAGRRAALRTVDLALSALAPDRGLKFLRLPDGDDPDSLIRREGARRFDIRLKNANPISEALFGMLAEGASKETPETRAKFYSRLVDTAARISDAPLAREYKRVLLGRFYEDWSPSKKGKSLAKPTFDRSQRVQIRPHDAVVRRGYVILSILIHFPLLFRDFEEALKRIHLDPPCADMFAVLSNFTFGEKRADFEEFMIYLHGLKLELKAQQVIATAAADYRPDPNLSLSEASNYIWHFYFLMPETIALLEQQRDEIRTNLLLNPDDKDGWHRLMRFEELLRLARAGEFAESEFPAIADAFKQPMPVVQTKKAS